MNNKKQSNLQFTGLTPDDIATHEDLYIELLLIDKFGMPCSGNCGQIYYDHAITELQKANSLFQKEFK